MALIYAADLNPGKADAIAAWLPGQPWAPAGELELVGAYRFDDPDGEVGCETHLARVDAAAIHVKDGAWVAAPPTVRLHGGGWTGGQISVSGFGAPEQDGEWTVLRNTEMEVRLARRPSPDSASPGSASASLTATWPGQDAPLLLAEVRHAT